MCFISKLAKVYKNISMVLMFVYKLHLKTCHLNVRTFLCSLSKLWSDALGEISVFLYWLSLLLREIYFRSKCTIISSFVFDALFLFHMLNTVCLPYSCTVRIFFTILSCHRCCTSPDVLMDGYLTARCAHWCCTKLEVVSNAVAMPVRFDVSVMYFMMSSLYFLFSWLVCDVEDV